MPFTGSWILDYASKHNVADWLKTLNISNNTVIDNQGLVSRIQRINHLCFLEGGLIYVENYRLYRIGKEVNSLQEFIRKEDFELIQNKIVVYNYYLKERYI